MLVEKLAETMDNIENDKTCPLFQKCRNYLPAEFGYSCINGRELCSKSEMVMINMLSDIMEMCKNG